MSENTKRELDSLLMETAYKEAREEGKIDDEDIIKELIEKYYSGEIPSILALAGAVEEIGIEGDIEAYYYIAGGSKMFPLSLIENRLRGYAKDNDVRSGVAYLAKLGLDGWLTRDQFAWASFIFFDDSENLVEQWESIVQLDGNDQYMKYCKSLYTLLSDTDEKEEKEEN